MPDANERLIRLLAADAALELEELERQVLVDPADLFALIEAAHAEPLAVPSTVWRKRLAAFRARVDAAQLAVAFAGGESPAGTVLRPLTPPGGTVGGMFAFSWTASDPTGAGRYELEVRAPDRVMVAVVGPETACSSDHGDLAALSAFPPGARYTWRVRVADPIGPWTIPLPFVIDPATSDDAHEQAARTYEAVGLLGEAVAALDRIADPLRRHLGREELARRRLAELAPDIDAAYATNDPAALPRLAELEALELYWTHRADDDARAVLQLAEDAELASQTS